MEKRCTGSASLRVAPRLLAVPEDISRRFYQRVHIMDGTTSVSLVTEGSSGLSRAHPQNRFDIDLFAIQAQLLTAAFHSKHRHPVCQLVTFRSHMCAYMG